MKVETNKHGVNTNIDYHPKDEATMRSLGFTDHREGFWYKCKYLDKDITFNVSFPKSYTSQDDLDIAVLDEMFLQPYDYQYLLSKHPNFEFALKIKDKVEQTMDELQSQGILSGHAKGEYI